MKIVPDGSLGGGGESGEELVHLPPGLKQQQQEARGEQEGEEHCLAVQLQGEEGHVKQYT